MQYNEYYPFGLQTAESWTRPDDTRNPYLFNAGSEWNESSLVYETNFRDYDPAIGRFYANDPLSLQGHSLTPYRFGFNNPVSFNDPTGLFEHLPEYWDRKEREWKISEALRLGIEFISSDVVRGGSFGGFIKTTETTITTFRGTVAERGGPRYGHGSSSSNAPRYVTFSVIHTTTTMTPNQGFIKFVVSGQNGGPPVGGGPPSGGDPGVQQRDPIVVHVTNQTHGVTTVRSYPVENRNSDGTLVLYEVPLYRIKVTGQKSNGERVIREFTGIRYGVQQNRSGSAYVEGIDEGAFPLEWSDFLLEYGGSYKIVGGGDFNGAYIHIGPGSYKNSEAAAIDCVLIGGGQWSSFNQTLIDLGFPSTSMTVIFQSAIAPQLKKTN